MMFSPMWPITNLTPRNPVKHTVHTKPKRMTRNILSKLQRRHRQRSPRIPQLLLNMRRRDPGMHVHHGIQFLGSLPERIVFGLIVHQHCLTVFTCRLEIVDPVIRGGQLGGEGVGYMSPTRPNSLTARRISLAAWTGSCILTLANPENRLGFFLHCSAM